MTELDRVRDQLIRAYRGPAWHGPAVFEILDDVEAPVAAAKPLAGAHSIWELVLHVTTWNRIPVRRLTEWRPIEPSDAENFPAIGAPSPDAWLAAKESLARSVDALADAISAFPRERLDETVPGHDYSVFVMLHGAVQHALYHAGQMAIVKKAVR